MDFKLFSNVRNSHFYRVFKVSFFVVQNMKRLERELQDCTNQIGRGNGEGVPSFELVRPPENNYFHIDVRQSKSFKQTHAAREITY